MIVKTTGIIFIIFSSTLIGFLIAGYYSDRPKELRSLQRALQMLETEIIYSSTPLPIAFKNILKKCDERISCLFKSLIENYNSKKIETIKEAWDKTIKQFYYESSLNLLDAEILLSFGNNLGNSDKDDQIKHLRMAISQLKQQEEKAIEMKSKNEKIWRYIGVLSGLTIVLLLF